MAFQENVLGVKDLKDNFDAIAKLLPGGQVADALADGAEVIREQAQQNVLDIPLIDTGALFDSIKVVKINQWQVAVRAGNRDVPYAAIHEFGRRNMVITPKQRRFFWAKFSETKKNLWKALALSVTYTMPPRPYLRPAADEKKLTAVKRTADSLTAAFIRKLRRA